MSHIIMIGAGVMSSAFAVASRDKHQVSIIPAPFDDKVVSKIKNTQMDERLGVSWPGIDFVDVNQVQSFDYVVVGVSSQGVPWALQVIKTLFQKSKAPVLLLTKGLIATESGVEVLSQYFSRKLDTAVIAVTGPCIAKLLADKVLTRVVFSARNMDVLQKAVSDFSQPYYQIEASQDEVGAQWLAALKNVYAILVAKAGSNLNLRSANFAQACQEMAVWMKEVGGDPETVCGLSGVGDLYVTCQGGRNGLFGQHLADGLAMMDIIEGPMKGVTVEGLDVAQLLVPLANKDKPLFQEIVETLLR